MATRRTALTFVLVAGLMSCAAAAIAQDRPRGAELPPAAATPDVMHDILQRAEVPNAPGQVMIVARTTYRPDAHRAKHQHPGQIVFYVLWGRMGVKEDGKDAIMLTTGDTLLVKPSTVHEHWNASSTEPLTFIEYVLGEKGQPSSVPVK